MRLPFAASVGIYVLSDLFIKALGIITLPLFSRMLGPAGYGLLAMVNLSSSALQLVANLGVEQSLIRVAIDKTSKEWPSLFRTAILTSGLSSSLAVLGIWLVTSPWLLVGPQNGTVLALALVLVPVLSLHNIINQWLRFLEMAPLAAALNCTQGVLQTACSILMAWGLGWGVPGILLGGALGATLALVVRLALTWKHLDGPYDHLLAKELIILGLPFLPAAAGQWALVLADRTMLGWLGTLEMVGTFSVAATLTSLGSLVVNAFGQAWYPRALKLWREQPDTWSTTYGNMAAFSLALFTTGAGLLVAFGPQILGWVAGEAFAKGAVALPGLCFGVVTSALSQTTALGIAQGKLIAKMAAVTLTWCIINVLVAAVLIPQWGSAGAAWATGLANLGICANYALITQKHHPIRYPTLEFAAAVLACLVGFMAPLILPWSVQMAVWMAVLAANAWVMLRLAPRLRLALG